MTQTDLQKKLVKQIRTDFRSVLKEQTKADRVTGLDTKYVSADRNVRPFKEGNDPKPLLFGGNHYAQLRTGKLVAQYQTWEKQKGKDRKLVSTDEQELTTEAIKQAWEETESRHFPNGHLQIDGQTFFVLDPQVTPTRIMFGLGTTAVMQTTAVEGNPAFQ